MRKILLVEPGYRNKYPPLGLMKISSYHKLAGDEVYFVKGCNDSYRKELWDRIYVSSLFTFYWNETVKTIEYYMRCVSSPSDLIVGGVLATLMGDELNRVTGARVISGLLDKPGMLDADIDIPVDSLIPDYMILDSSDYKYHVNDAYIAYATRGCPNKCEFCAVHKLEPTYRGYLPLKSQIMAIEEVFGEKQNLVLLDNNVLASKELDRIIHEIRALGFEAGALRSGRKRYIDFNQGLDARLLTESKMALLATTAIKPLRIAFDDVSIKDVYVKKIRLAAKYGLKNLSNYVLYNFRDTPEDFYQRLRINCELNNELGTKIYSFPMKYIPLNAKNRKFVGENWNRKILRGIQCVLLATHGMVSPKLDFFEAAFGRDENEFLQITLMPNLYIMRRRKYENEGAESWLSSFRKLTMAQKKDLLEMHSTGSIKEEHYTLTSSKQLRQVLEHYLEADRLEKEWNRSCSKKS